MCARRQRGSHLMSRSSAADRCCSPDLLTERQAADALGVSIDTLRRERKRRRIGYIMIGGRPRYTDRQLAAYISLREVKPCDENSNQLAPDKSATTGSAGGRIAPCGAERGSTPTLDRRAEHRSALMILQPPASRSRNGSQPTSAPIEPQPNEITLARVFVRYYERHGKHIIGAEAQRVSLAMM